MADYCWCPEVPTVWHPFSTDSLIHHMQHLTSALNLSHAHAIAVISRENAKIGIHTLGICKHGCFVAFASEVTYFRMS